VSRNSFRTRGMKRLPRRGFLAAGGSMLALPWLESRAAKAAEEAPPKRLVLMYTPNGRVQDRWFPAEGATEDNWELSEILEPLAPFKDKLCVFSGIDLSVTTVGPGGPHQRGIGALFSGQKLQSGDFVDGCGKRAGWVDGITVDQAAAQHIGASTPFPSIELAVRAIEADVQSRISYAGPGQPLPPTNDPTELYNRLFFGLVAPPLDGSDPMAERNSVLDAVKSQFSMLSQRLGAADRERLERHLELVRDLERRLGIGVNTDGCAQPEAPAEVDPNGEDDMPAILETHFDLLAMALGCDLTRVASVQISTALNRIRYPWVGSLGEGHALSHAGPSNADAWNQLTAREKWHTERLAAFLQKLADTPEGEGSVLDNTLVLWGTDVSWGNTHTLTDLPYLMVGDLGGAFRTGRYLKYDGVPNNNLMVSILNALGVETETFGDPEFCTGELTGLT
jgi:hypothetical protein